MIILKKLDPGMYRPVNSLFITYKSDKIKVQVKSFELHLSIYEYSIHKNSLTVNSSRYNGHPGITGFFLNCTIEKINKNYSGTLGDINVGDDILITPTKLSPVTTSSNSYQLSIHYQLKFNDVPVNVSSDITGTYKALRIPIGDSSNYESNLSYDVNKDKYSMIQIGSDIYSIIYYFRIIDNKVLVNYPDVKIIYDDCGLRNVINDDDYDEMCFPTLEKAQQKLEEILF